MTNATIVYEAVGARDDMLPTSAPRIQLPEHGGLVIVKATDPLQKDREARNRWYACVWDSDGDADGPAVPQYYRHFKGLDQQGKHTEGWWADHDVPFWLVETIKERIALTRCEAEADDNHCGDGSGDLLADFISGMFERPGGGGAYDLQDFRVSTASIYAAFVDWVGATKKLPRAWGRRTLTIKLKEHAGRLGIRYLKSGPLRGFTGIRKPADLGRRFGGGGGRDH